MAEARAIKVGGSLPMRVLREGAEIDVRVAMIEKPKSIHRWKLEHWKNTPMLPYEADLVRPAGGRVSSAESDGKVRVLYFWASWCGPCRKTSPMLDELYAEVGPAKLELLAVSSEERSVIEKYLAKGKTSFPVVHDAEGYFKLDYEVKKLPTIVVIGPTGQVVSWDTSVSGVRKAVETVRSLLSS